jgi:hypothetical protein
MSSEQDPLLPSTYPREQPDEQEDESQAGLLSTSRTRVAEALESNTLHKLIITLVRFSLACTPFASPH